jgi:hypothetical protein
LDSEVDIDQTGRKAQGLSSLCDYYPLNYQSELDPLRISSVQRWGSREGSPARWEWRCKMTLDYGRLVQPRPPG